MSESRQLKYQRKMVSLGKCKICGKALSDSSKYLCEHHLEQKREHDRKWREKNREEQL